MIKANVKAVREVVGLFADRESFEAAVAELTEAGFARTDLSVLGSHESLDAAGEPGKQWKDALIALVGELKFEVPLVASGAIVLAGGPTAALIGGLIGAAVGGIAIKDVIGEVTATPHTEDFARAVEAGSVILWVRADAAAGEDAAGVILRANGGTNVHVHEYSSAAERT
ncbi:MAG: hypothetical protein QGI63_11030 [Rhodospirillales bacterium]|jgi:hypothetical protein|nr:hypothetical protein [Rhodospirillales bacterium]MDP6774796.1 hypothetical protein [Rhodospirillales bacterium]